MPLSDLFECYAATGALGTRPGAAFGGMCGQLALGTIDFWNISIPIPVALAAVAVIGYLIGRRAHAGTETLAAQSRRDMRRAQQVARELEKISWMVRRNLSKHHSSLMKFKQRVDHLSTHQRDVAWKELCQEAEEMLKPTLQLATQIANAYDEIRQQSSHLMTFTEVRTDPLTGISNRRAMDETLTAQFALMSRYESTFSLSIFDIDHFKRVNDEQGHLSGDRILQKVAHMLDESVRETDMVARYGGEEFVVVMPQTDLEGASIFADRIRQRIAEKTKVTVSGGVAMAMDGDTPDTILARADAALYSAKTGGRNCVFRHNGDHIEAIAAPTTTSPV